MALGSEGGAAPNQRAHRIAILQRPALRFGALALLLMASELLYAGWKGFEDTSFPVDQVVGTLLLLNILYLLAVFLLLRISEASHSHLLAINRVVFAAAILFRLTLAPLGPILSDDLYRYRWEGMLQSVGGNPYQTAPQDPAAFGIRDETYSRIPVKEAPGGYGPLTMLVERASFALVSRVSDDPQAQTILSKWPSAAADLAVILLLAGWLRARGKPTLLAGLYALSPLPVVEFWGMGHNDALAIACLVAAFLAMDTRREGLGFLCLGAAVAFKWWPALLLPAFLGFSRQTPRRLVLAAAGLAVVPLAFLPYWSDVAQNARFMGGFAGGWRNNDSLFGLTFALAGGDFETAKWWTLAMIGALSVCGGILIRPRERAALVVLAGTLLLSANCHPWYLTWFVPFLAFLPWPPLLLWVALAPLFYEVLIDYHLTGVWQGSRHSRWLVYAPVFALAGFYALRSLMKRNVQRP